MRPDQYMNEFIKNNLMSCNSVFLKFVVCLSLFFSFSYQVHADNIFAVFSLNKDFKPLTKNKVRMIYRGKTKRLQNNKIELCDWSESHYVRNQFYQILLKKDVAQMNAYWASLSFSGKARPPKVIKEDSMEELLQWVSAKKTRIGYAKLELLPKTANILYIVKREEK